MQTKEKAIDRERDIVSERGRERYIERERERARAIMRKNNKRLRDREIERG